MEALIIKKIKTKTSPDNALIVNVEITTTIPVVAYIVYKNKYAGKFVSAVTTTFQKKNVINLVRLRAATEYNFRVYLTTENGQTLCSKCYCFRTDPLPQILEQSLKLSMEGYFSKNYVIVLCINGLVSPSNFFQGYVAVDFAGQIVWYYQSPPGITPVSGDFFQLESGNFLITLGNTLGTPLQTAGTFQAAQMQIINGLGKLLYQQPLVCETSPENIGVKFSTIANFGWTHAAWQNPGKKDAILDLGLVLHDPYFDAGFAPPGVRMQLGETIREWIPATGEQKIITSAFELEDPFTYRGTLSDDSYGPPVNCTGDEPGLENQDWTHGNAISRFDATRNWIVSQRNTSSVLILDPVTFKLLLKFGVTKPTDLVFVNPNDQFYNQHDAHELENGNIIMFDDGTSRPISEGGPYARGIEYFLDLKKKTIQKVWEFRPQKDLKCEEGGSARRLDNGHTIVDFGASNLEVKHVFEAGRKSNRAIADLSVVSGIPNNEFLLYRAVPIKSIFGEKMV